jgi:hypothetical protein
MNVSSYELASSWYLLPGWGSTYRNQRSYISAKVSISLFIKGGRRTPMRITSWSDSILHGFVFLFILFILFIHLLLFLCSFGHLSELGSLSLVLFLSMVDHLFSFSLPDGLIRYKRRCFTLFKEISLSCLSISLMGEKICRLIRGSKTILLLLDFLLKWSEIRTSTFICSYFSLFTWSLLQLINCFFCWFTIFICFNCLIYVRIGDIKDLLWLSIQLDEGIGWIELLFSSLLKLL